MSQQWNPLQDLLVLQDRMNRLFEDATHRRAREESESRDDRDDFARADWIPASDIYETEAAYLIAIDLPGIERAAIDLELDDNRLVVRGNRVVEEVKQHRSERPHGRFVRTFTVPGSVEQKGIAAEYKDGVLQITLPKRKEQEQKPKRVEINVS